MIRLHFSSFSLFRSFVFSLLLVLSSCQRDECEKRVKNHQDSLENGFYCHHHRMFMIMITLWFICRKREYTFSYSSIGISIKMVRQHYIHHTQYTHTRVCIRERTSYIAFSSIFELFFPFSLSRVESSAIWVERPENQKRKRMNDFWEYTCKRAYVEQRMCFVLPICKMLNQLNSYVRVWNFDLHCTHITHTT